MKTLFKIIFSIGFLWGHSVSAKVATNYDFEGFVRVSEQRELFVQWQKASPGQPTVVLLNGLTYSTRQWNEFAQALHGHGIGVIQYDMTGMGQTLLKYAPATEIITYQTQVQELKGLLLALKISKANLVGLSYGGGIAIAFAGAYPQMVNTAILMAPYTEPLASQDLGIKMQVLATRLMYPYNPYSNDELYDYFLRLNVYTTYPAAEPIVLENPYKLEATFRMAQGVRSLDSVKSISTAPAKSIHLVIAGSDEYINRSVLEKFWTHVPESAQGSKTIILGTKHKIPENIPQHSADWVATILQNSRRIQAGRIFETNSATGIVRSESGDEFQIGTKN